MHRTRNRSSVTAARSAGSRRISRRSAAGLTVATLVACAGFAATAAAVFTTSGGTTQLSMSNVGQDVATTKQTAGWSPLPGATTTVTVPNGAVLNARFTAQSLCTHAGGTISGRCSVRITANGVALKPSGAAFAFDSIGSGVNSIGGSESHAIERSTTLAAGTYTIQVSLLTTAQTKFVVSYWHLAAEASAP